MWSGECVKERDKREEIIIEWGLFFAPWVALVGVGVGIGVDVVALFGGSAVDEALNYASLVDFLVELFVVAGVVAEGHYVDVEYALGYAPWLNVAEETYGMSYVSEVFFRHEAEADVEFLARRDNVVCFAIDRYAAARGLYISEDQYVGADVCYFVLHVEFLPLDYGVVGADGVLNLDGRHVDFFLAAREWDNGRGYEG